MLRITQTIELKLRKNESRFSRDFLKGLGIALSLHLLLFLLFRIASLPNLETVKPLPPIAVETDLHTSDIEVLPVVKTGPLPMEALESPHYFDTFHDQFLFQPKKELFSVKQIAIDKPDFSEIEKMDYSPLPNILMEEDD